MTLNMVTDRTSADVERWRTLQQKGYAAMTADEKAEWISGTMKGAYNASDMNRVGVALNYLRDALADEEFMPRDAFTAKTDWKESDIPTVNDLTRYLSYVESVRSATIHFAETPRTPVNTRALNYRDANDIEKILLSSERILHNMCAAWFFLDDLYCGEV